MAFQDSQGDSRVLESFKGVPGVPMRVPWQMYKRVSGASQEISGTPGGLNALHGHGRLGGLRDFSVCGREFQRPREFKGYQEHLRESKRHVKDSQGVL